MPSNSMLKLISNGKKSGQKIANEQSKTRTRYDSVLPEEFVAEFEQRFVQTREDLELFSISPD